MPVFTITRIGNIPFTWKNGERPEARIFLDKRTAQAHADLANKTLGINECSLTEHDTVDVAKEFVLYKMNKFDDGSIWFHTFSAIGRY